MAEKRSEAMVSTEGRELVVTRVFDAPRKMVWDAWTIRSSWCFGMGRMVLLPRLK